MPSLHSCHQGASRLGDCHKTQQSQGDMDWGPEREVPNEVMEEPLAIQTGLEEQGNLAWTGSHRWSRRWLGEGDKGSSGRAGKETSPSKGSCTSCRVWTLSPQVVARFWCDTSLDEFTPKLRTQDPRVCQSLWVLGLRCDVSLCCFQWLQRLSLDVSLGGCPKPWRHVRLQSRNERSGQQMLPGQASM